MDIPISCRRKSLPFMQAARSRGCTEKDLTKPIHLLHTISLAIEKKKRERIE